MEPPNKAQGDLPIDPSAAHRGANNSRKCSKRVLRVIRGGGVGNSGNSAMAADSLEQLQRGAEVVETVVLELTEEEEKIFQRLLDVVCHFHLGTTLRVAGGWVRDKLLGEQPADIDIALDNKTGLEFCVILNEYNKLIGEKLEEPQVIQSNPDRSKHLETAKMSVCSKKEIDFVNLRSENYVESSRIPTMKNGTAEQDAYRRDLTINSLFYNINDNCVEDFTRRGIDDLKKGLIVTPLDPKATFLDDPLRVLRAIRFGKFKHLLVDLNMHIEVTRYIVKESLKLPACLAKSVVGIHAASGKFAEFLLLFESNVASGTLKEELEDVYLDLPTDTLNRVCAGVILAEIKDFWRVALAISILSYYPEAENALSQQDRSKEKYMEVEHFITDLGEVN
ncbi:hypothetical protein ACQ4PT_057969 [Festuca glaucescens]